MLLPLRSERPLGIGTYFHVMAPLPKHIKILTMTLRVLGSWILSRLTISTLLTMSSPNPMEPSSNGRKTVSGFLVKSLGMQKLPRVQSSGDLAILYQW